MAYLFSEEISDREGDHRFQSTGAAVFSDSDLAVPSGFAVLG